MSYYDLDNQKREAAKQLILAELKKQPISVEDATKILTAEGFPLARTLGKEIAWQMAEDEEAFFNSDWNLELKPKPKSTLEILLIQIKSGIFPVIEFTKSTDFLDFEPGMRARCIGAALEHEEEDPSDTVYQINLDFSEFKEFNQALEQPIWYKGRDPLELQKWSETSFYPKDCKCRIFVDSKSDFYKVIESEGRLNLFAQYQKDRAISKTQSYIEWLENQLIKHEKPN